MPKNVIVGQSGGPTAVINASLAGVAAEALSAGDRVFGMNHGIQGFERGEICELSPLLAREQDLRLLGSTPAAWLGSCRCRLPSPDAEPERFAAIFRRLKELEIGAFFYIGGNDSMDTIRKLSDYGAAAGSDIAFVGVPKTIDNDLAVTDHTPGYGSAARYIATAMKELICDGLVYDEKRVTLVEIMGRNAGWLAGAAALCAGEDCCGPDLLYLPELPFDPEDFVRRVEELQHTRKSVMVALSEGIRTAGGQYVCELSAAAGDTDVFGHRQLSGAAVYLASLLSHRLGAKCRAVELSTMQRCAAHLASGTDVREAFGAGAAAVRAAQNGSTGCMVTLQRLSQQPYRCGFGTVDVHTVANAEKTVPAEWIDPVRAGVREPFLQYLRPLVQGEPDTVWKDGLPVHFCARPAPLL